jgi:anti-sigma regulatory factor (Ser/Thr protein kinase)
MKSDQTASANGRTRVRPDDRGSDPVPDALQAKCGHQAMVIDTLSEALSTFERGARALKAENSALRAENDRLSRRRLASRPDGGVDGDEPAEAAIPIGVQAPSVARRLVARWLAERVAPSVLETALLLVSELVSNSVRHSGVPEGEDLVVRAQLWAEGLRLEVEDPGRAGVIAPQPPDLLRGGGMGLHLVQKLSERWGLERVAAGGTRVWAQLASAPLIAPAPAEPSNVGGARSSPNGSRTMGAARPPVGGSR